MGREYPYMYTSDKIAIILKHAWSSIFVLKTA